VAEYPLTPERLEMVLDGLGARWGRRPVVTEVQPIGHGYPFPHHSPNWSVLPDDIVRAADRAYREALPAHLLQGYDEMLAIGAAVALAGRIIRLPVIARADQTAYDSWRRRAQVVQQISVFTNLTAGADALPAFSQWTTALAAAITNRWPDATTPPPRVYAAFRTEVAR